MQNKPNFIHFSPENADFTKKQSQFKPNLTQNKPNLSQFKAKTNPILSAVGGFKANPASVFRFLFFLVYSYVLSIICPKMRISVKF